MSRSARSPADSAGRPRRSRARSPPTAAATTIGLGGPTTAAYLKARRPKAAKLDDPRLARQVTEWLEAWWSPEEIARRLPIEFPADSMMRVSHETIYQAIYVQGRGELRRELARCLRTARAQRRPRNRTETRGRIPDMVMISERPAEVDDRAVPGHWEGDLIIGKNGRSAVGTLVERTTRYLLLLHLPDGKEADKVDAAMRRAVAKLPGEFFRTITWDQGKEMASTPRSPSTPASRCTSATPTARGSVGRTRTPTGSSASTCPKAPTCQDSPRRNSTQSPAASTTDHASGLRS